MKIALPLAALPLAAVALLTPTLAAAQSMNGPNYSTYEPGFRANSLIPTSDTPTMRRDKLKRAQTLRAEVDAMMAANGGTLTAASPGPRHGAVFTLQLPTPQLADLPPAREAH